CADQEGGLNARPSKARLPRSAGDISAAHEDVTIRTIPSRAALVTPLPPNISEPSMPGASPEKGTVPLSSKGLSGKGDCPSSAKGLCPFPDSPHFRRGSKDFDACSDSITSSQRSTPDRGTVSMVCKDCFSCAALAF